MKSHAYMKGAEFKARQGWLPFMDAVGVALEVLEPVKKRGFRTKCPVFVPAQKQLEIFYWAARETPALF